MYNLSELGNGATMGELVSYSNNSAGGWLFTFIIGAIFFVVLWRLKDNVDLDVLLLVDSFCCFVLSLFLFFGEYISGYVPLAFLCIAGFSALYVYMAQKN